MQGQCEVLRCTEPARYGIYKTYPNDDKVWLHVCRLHEKYIGSENLERAGGYLTKSKRRDENGNTTASN